LDWGAHFIVDCWKNQNSSDVSERSVVCGECSNAIEIYSSIGELEGDDGENPQAKLDEFLAQAKLRCPRLEISGEVLAREKHCSAVPLHICRAIRQFFIDKPV
jgi:hypothetical protein